MGDFDDFNVNGSMSGVLPKTHSIPTTVRDSRTRLGGTGPLPKMYTDLNYKRKKNASTVHTNPNSKPDLAD